MVRAAALGEYRVGAPLPFEELRFARSSSAVAIALAWLERGSPGSPAAARAAIAEVEALCTDMGYPQTRFDAGTVAAAELLRRVSHGDIAEMGSLLAQVRVSVGAVGWSVPAGRPVARLTNCSDLPANVLRLDRAPPVPEPVSGAANRSKPTVPGVAGRPSTAAAPAGPQRTARCTALHRRTLK